MKESYELTTITQLPDILDVSTKTIENITDLFNIPREVIASSSEIQYAWNELPRELALIDPLYRNEFMVRMCIATSVGLFDSAINYIWNCVENSLKDKLKTFGLPVISQILTKNFEEKHLLELKAAELLDLAYQLEILSQENYYYLDQCRDIRNKCSAAHPNIAKIDDRELIIFIHRCCKHGLQANNFIKGINIDSMINILKSNRLDEEQLNILAQKISDTFLAQQKLVLPMLYGIYCDENSSMVAKDNVLNLCEKSLKLINTEIISVFLDRHNDYFLKGNTTAYDSSSLFFEKLALIKYLSDSEHHSMISKACNKLLYVHLGFNNFYNEPPFAERLFELSNQMTIIPDTIKIGYVETILLCYVGNGYGVSSSAMNYYSTMIQNFTPKEIVIMLRARENNERLKIRLHNNPSCKKNYKLALELISKSSLTTEMIKEINTALKS